MELKVEKKSRFQIDKLEDRIAPASLAAALSTSGSASVTAGPISATANWSASAAASVNLPAL